MNYGLEEARTKGVWAKTETSFNFFSYFDERDPQHFTEDTPTLLVLIKKYAEAYFHKWEAKWHNKIGKEDNKTQPNETSHSHFYHV